MPERSHVLVFGEDPNDTRSIRELAQCLRPDLSVKTRRQPIILARDAAEAKRKTNFEAIAAVVRAEGAAARAVILHRDCDAVEPAHEEESKRIEEAAKRALRSSSVKVIAATPAFELETWWYLFPDAIAAHRPSWRRPDRKDKNVGRIVDAKEQLRRDLRPPGNQRVPDYRESDAPEIARKVRDLGLCAKPCAKSGSFASFADKVRAL